VINPSKRIVRWVHRPDDLVQRARRFPGSLGDLPGVRLNLVRQVLVALDQLTQQRHLGEARAQLIVQIAGDPRAFVIQGLLLAQSLDLPLQSLGREVIDAAHDAPQQQCRAAQKPPGPPERRLDHDGQFGPRFVPYSVLVRRRHFETILHPAAVAVARHPIVAGRNPIRLVSNHPITELARSGAARLRLV
jgi:hypothetical protein